MPRNPTTGVYTIPAGIKGVTDQTIESLDYNSFLDDVETDLNTPRPIVAGGTGSSNASDTMTALRGDTAYQLVTNYASHVFVSGSFYSAIGASSAPPSGGTATSAFAGVCYSADAPATPPANQNLVLEARDLTDAAEPGRLYIRRRKAGVWGAWSTEIVVLPAAPTAPTDATNKAYVDAGDAALTANVNNRVVRTGDTMTGALNAPHFAALNNTYYFGSAANYLNYLTGTFNFSAGVNCGPIYSTGTSRFADHVLLVGTGQPCFAVHNPAAGQSWGYWIDSGPMRIGNTDANGTPLGNWMTITAGAGMTCNQAAFKPGGGSWADSSDARIKNVLGDYDTGLDAVTSLNPVRFTFKGNDGTGHQDVATKATEFIGLIAQDTEAAMPELVSKTNGTIDDVAVTDLRILDTTPLIYALINCIKELKARVEALEAG